MARSMSAIRSSGSSNPTDSRTKVVTVLIYMNGKWESPRGRLRLLRSSTDLNAVIAEVPPDEGTLLVFRNDENAWHGFEAFDGRWRNGRQRVVRQSLPRSKKPVPARALFVSILCLPSWLQVMSKAAPPACRY